MAKDFQRFITHLKLEALSLAVLMVVLTYNSSASLLVLPLSFLVFDIGIAGYVLNKRIGAATYNFMHNFTIPTLLIAYGILFGPEVISIIGFCWTFHIAVDRSLGFGLKHDHSFHETHLGKINRKA